MLTGEDDRHGWDLNNVRYKERIKSRLMESMIRLNKDASIERIEEAHSLVFFDNIIKDKESVTVIRETEFEYVKSEILDIVGLVKLKEKFDLLEKYQERKI